MQIRAIWHILFGKIRGNNHTYTAYNFHNLKSHKYIIHRSRGNFESIPTHIRLWRVKVNGCNQDIESTVDKQQGIDKPFWNFNILPAENKHQCAVIGKRFSEIFEFSYGKKRLPGTTHNINAFCYQCDKAACDCQKKFTFIGSVLFLGNNHQQGKCYKNTKQVQGKPSCRKYHNGGLLYLKVR